MHEDLRNELVKRGFYVSFYVEEGRYGDVRDRGLNSVDVYYSVETYMVVRW